MANNRDRQPEELDYYELRKRRQEVLARRAKQRPEWDTEPARRTTVRRSRPAPVVSEEDEKKIKRSKPGVETFPPKQPVIRPAEAPAAEQAAPRAAQTRPVQPKTAPIVRNPIHVPEEEIIEPAAPVYEAPAADIPEETVDIPEAADIPEAPDAEEAFDAPAEDAPEMDYEDEPTDFGDNDAIGIADEEPVEENIGNNPFTPFVKLADTMAGKFGEWKQNRAQKAAENGDAPKKRGLKGLFGKKQAAATDDWAEQPAEEFAEGAFPAEENIADVQVEAFVDEAAAQPAEEAAADIAEAPAADIIDEPVADIEDAPAADIIDEPVADIADAPAEDAFEEPIMEEGFEEASVDAFEEEQPKKKKFSLKNLFSRKKKAKVEDDLLEGFDDLEDMDGLDGDIDAVQEQLEDELDAAADEQWMNPEQPVEEAAEIFEEIPAQIDVTDEGPIAEIIEDAVEVADEPAETAAEAIEAMEVIDETAEEAAEAEEVIDEAAEEIADISDDMTEDDAMDEADELPEDMEEDIAPPKKKGLFGFFRRSEKSADEALLALLGDDDDDEDEDWEEVFSLDDERSSEEDMDEKNLIASQMADGIGERPLSRKERRALAERQAAEASQIVDTVEEGVEETAAPVAEDIDEPTREFTPVRREAAPAEEDDYDAFEKEQEAEEQPKKGLFGRKKKVKIDEMDELLFDDDDDDYEPAPKKAKKSRYEEDEDDYDDYDDDDDYDDYDDDDYDDDYDDEDDDEGGSFFGGLIKAIFTIIVIAAAAVIVLNLLASRGIAPAQSAVNAIGGMLPEKVTEVIFPGYEAEDDIVNVEPTEVPAEPTEVPAEPTEVPAEATDAPVEATDAPVEQSADAPVGEATEQPAE